MRCAIALIILETWAGMVQERSPSTNVYRARFPDPALYVGWVCFWFSTLRVFSSVGFICFSLSSKIDISKFQFDPVMHGHFWKKQMTWHALYFGMFFSPACGSERLRFCCCCCSFFAVTPIDEEVTHLLKQTSSTCQQYLVRNPLLSLKFGTY